MAQQKGLHRFLEFIGIVDNDEAAPSARSPYSQEEAYEPQRFTPGPAARRPEPEDARGGSRFPMNAHAAGETHRARGGESRLRFRPEPRPQEKALSRTDRKLRVNASTMVYKIRTLNECSDVIQDLIGGNSVLLNMEGTDLALMQRIVDTLAGASFAINAKIRKVSEKTYLIAPENVQVNIPASAERRY